jgi:hypothetical protein
MSGKGSSFGKPLKGSSVISERISKPIQDDLFNTLNSGVFPIQDVTITGGTINGVIIGSDAPGPASFTTLSSGDPFGNGFQVCFYGTNIADRTCWIPNIGQWNIQGDLLVRDVSDLGNIRVSVNTLSATNTNGNINLTANGTGIININGGVSQSTLNGNILFNSTNGNFNTAASRSSIISRQGLSMSTDNGSLNFITGNNIVSRTITFVTTGTSPTITTSVPHLYNTGDNVRFSNVNTVPILDGDYTITDIVSTTSFRINVSPSITGIGISGDVRRVNNINLRPTDRVTIPNNIHLQYGQSCNSINGDGSNLHVNSCDSIFMNSQSVVIPTNTQLRFSNSNKNILSDGTDLLISNSSGKVIINSDLQVNGNTVYVNSQIVSINDPVFTVGGNSLIPDSKYRGIEFKYHDGISIKSGFFGRNTSTGCFTYIPNASSTDGEIFTGTPGCAVFGGLTATSIDLGGGQVIGIGNIQACNLTCNSNMTITSQGTTTMTNTELSINTQKLSTTSNLIYINGGTGNQFDKGLVFNTDSTEFGFIGYDTSSDCFSFLKNVNITGSEIVSSTRGNMCLGNTTIHGETTFNGSIKKLLKTEHLTVNTTGSPNSNINITWVYITNTSGISTGTLDAGLEDGFQKHIFLANTLGGVYHLTCPVGILLDPGSGTTASKTLQFSTSGQSVFLIWNSVLNTYLIVNAGCCIA